MAAVRNQLVLIGPGVAALANAAGAIDRTTERTIREVKRFLKPILLSWCSPWGKITKLLLPYS